MDIFSEYMVKRKKRAVDYIKIVLSIVMIVGIVCLMPILPGLFPYVGVLLFLGCAGLIYLFYNIIIGTKVEYEYTFTNGSLDVDKIIAARRRKKITTLNARGIEVMATLESNELDRYINDRSVKKYYACTSVNDAGVYAVVYSDDAKRYMLLFNPNEEIKNGFKRLNPQKVFLED